MWLDFGVWNFVQSVTVRYGATILMPEPIQYAVVSNAFLSVLVYGWSDYN